MKVSERGVSVAPEQLFEAILSIAQSSMVDVNSFYIETKLNIKFSHSEALPRNSAGPARVVYFTGDGALADKSLGVRYEDELDGTKQVNVSIGGPPSRPIHAHLCITSDMVANKLKNGEWSHQRSDRWHGYNSDIYQKHGNSLILVWRENCLGQARIMFAK